MLDFIFSRGSDLKFELAVTDFELQVLGLIRIDTPLAKKYFKLYKKFVKSSQGSLTATAFLHFFDVDRSFVTDQLFGLTTITRNDKITFVKFVYTVWYACLMTFDDLCKTSFATFSIKNATEMEIDDLERLVIALYGCNEHSDWRKIKAAKKIHSELFNACVDHYGTVDYDTFRYVVRHHGTFMFPVFDIQRVVRNKTFGNRYWDGLDPDRQLSVKAKHFTRDEILVMVRDHPPPVVIGMINNTGGHAEFVSKDAIKMSCVDDVERRDMEGRPLPARQKSALSAQTAARRVQFFSGEDIDIDDINRRYKKKLDQANQPAEGGGAANAVRQEDKSSLVSVPVDSGGVVRDKELSKWDNQISLRQQEDNKQKPTVSGMEGGGITANLFDPRYKNKKVVPTEAPSPKIQKELSAFDNGWDYLMYYDDTPQHREKRGVDAAKVMPTGGARDSDENEVKYPPSHRHGRASAKDMEGFDVADARAIQEAYDNHLDELVGFSQRPIRSFNVEEYIQTVHEDSFDFYGNPGIFNQRAEKKRTPMTTREVVDVCVVLREEAEKRNHPLDEASAPVNEFYDADEKWELEKEKRRLKVPPTREARLKQEKDARKLLSMRFAPDGAIARAQEKRLRNEKNQQQRRPVSAPMAGRVSKTGNEEEEGAMTRTVLADSAVPRQRGEDIPPAVAAWAPDAAAVVRVGRDGYAVPTFKSLSSRSSTKFVLKKKKEPLSSDSGKKFRLKRKETHEHSSSHVTMKLKPRSKNRG